MTGNVEASFPPPLPEVPVENHMGQIPIQDKLLIAILI